MSLVIRNILLFQIGWFSCVLSAANSLTILGCIMVAAIIAYHLYQAKNPMPEWQLIGIAVLIGTIWDSLLVSFNLLSYQQGMLHSNLAPYWIIAMWALFATTLNISLQRFKHHPWEAVLFGALGGPLAYYAGAKLGAVNLNNSQISLLVIALGWAVIMPVLVILSKQFNGFGRWQY